MQRVRVPELRVPESHVVSSTMSHRYILTLSCPDRMGIVAAVANLLLQEQCNIIDSAQFGDDENQLFFMRVYFTTDRNGDAVQDGDCERSQQDATLWRQRRTIRIGGHSAPFRFLVNILPATKLVQPVLAGLSVRA